MNSLKDLYKIGPGPSSSHTIAPWKACLVYLEAYPQANHFQVVLYGSLAKTAIGHLTDEVIRRTLAPHQCDIILEPGINKVHPLSFSVQGSINNLQFPIWDFESIGGGELTVNGVKNSTCEPYLESSFQEIKEFCLKNQLSLIQYIYLREPDIHLYLNEIKKHMLEVIETGLKTTGYLPGKLNIMRIAKEIYLKAEHTETANDRTRLKIIASAYATSEENACGNKVVTAPTLGSAGVLPAVIKHYYDLGFSGKRLVNALAVAGIFGNLVKTNATISGAVGGCQAEIGTACAMASAAIAYLEELDISQIEAAAEIGMEHHLGLTCDPVGGYVMIPCIERNAIAAVRALDAVLLAKTIVPIRNNRITFDMVVNTMKYTGSKIAVELKETALGGLATEIKIEH